MQQRLQERIAPDTKWQREAHIAKAKKQMCFAVYAVSNRIEKSVVRGLNFSGFCGRLLDGSSPVLGKISGVSASNVTHLRHSATSPAGV